MQLLLASLADGNYRDVACAVAGIAKRTFYNTIKRAEAGDEAAIAFVHAVENAEATAEAEMVNCVRNAAKKGPQFWAAGATFLERKSPDRWGRRSEEGSAPKVLVQIGASASDITVNVIANYQTQSPSEGLTSQPLADTPPTTFASESEGRKLLEGAKVHDVVTVDQAPATSTQAGLRRGKSTGDPSRTPVPHTARRARQGKGR